MSQSTSSVAASKPPQTAPVPVRVVLAAIIDADGFILVTQRVSGVHLPDAWEFPGGKAAPAEEDRDAIVRELREEVGLLIRPTACDAVASTEFAWPERRVRLSLWIVRVPGRPRVLHRAVAAHRWVPPDQLLAVPWPDANLPLLPALLDRIAHDARR